MAKRGGGVQGRAGFGWIPKGGNVCFRGRDLGGMIYFGHPPRQSHGRPASGWIDPRQPVSLRGGDRIALHYNPNYSILDGRSRATYLDWLASGRSDPEIDARYVRLYFHGLERRVFVDHAEPDERADIVAEVRRLLDTYGEDFIVRNSLESFLDAAGLLEPDRDDEPIFDLHRVRRELPATVLRALGLRAARGEPLTTDWLLSWFVCDPYGYAPALAERAFPEFRAGFRHFFTEQYPDGLTVRVPKRRLRFGYRAASGNFSVDLTEHLGGAGDVSGFSAPVRIAAGIAGSVADELDRFSRNLAEHPDDRGAIAARLLLPEFLWPQFPCPERDEFLAWARKHTASGRLVGPGEVIRRLGATPPDQIANNDLRDLAEILGGLGLGMAPDPRFRFGRLPPDTPLFLFQLPKDTPRTESPSRAYPGAILELAFGILVARADGEVSAQGRAHLAAAIEANQDLTEADRARLLADLVWMAEFPPDPELLERKVERASDRRRRRLVRAAFAAAVAEGDHGAAKARVVGRFHEILFRPVARFRADLRRPGAAPDDPVTVRPARRAPREFAIPSPPPPEAPRAPVTLDAGRVSEAEADTAKVSRMLGSIFNADVVGSEVGQSNGGAARTHGGPVEQSNGGAARTHGGPVEERAGRAARTHDGAVEENAGDAARTHGGAVEESAGDAAPAAGDRWNGLDPAHRAVASALITRRQWTEAELTGLARKHRLMRAGALETINEWSVGEFGEALLEEHDGVEVNHEVAGQLAS